MKTKLTFVLTAIAVITMSNLQKANAQTGNWKLAGNNLTGTEKLGSLNNFPLRIFTDNIERMRIEGSGKVGIGTTAPDSLFTVNGTSHLINHVMIGLNSGPSQFLQFGTSAWMKFPQNQYIWRHSNSQEGMFSNYTLRREEIRDSVAVPTMWFEWTTTGRTYFKGNMGIGANPNTARLFVKGTSTGELTRFDGGNSAFNTIYENGIYRGYWGSFAGNAEDVDFGTGSGNTTGKLHLTIQAVPKVTIDAAGNMGIGTTTPEGTLHVFRGSAGTITANVNAPFVVENSTSNYINLLTPSASERGILFGDNLNAQDGGIIYVGTTNNMEFRTNGNLTRMLLTSGGNLGINNSNPANQLQVGNNTGAAVGIGSLEKFADAGSFLLSSNSDFVSDIDGVNDLGTSILRWGEVWAVDGTINTSDLRDKKNIEDLKYGLKEIMQLRPVKFQWKNSQNQNDKFGVIAQEIQKVLPQVVKDYEYKRDETTGKKEKVPSARLGVMYSDLIPVLIKALQEQQEQINDLRKMIGNSTQDQSVSATGTATESAKTNVVLSNAKLEQNNPNPFTNTTNIRYTIPAGAKNAQLVITDNSGKPVKQVSLSAGTGVVNIDASALSSGTYNYTLLVDGKVIESKKMAVTR